MNHLSQSIETARLNWAQEYFESRLEPEAEEETQARNIKKVHAGSFQAGVNDGEKVELLAGVNNEPAPIDRKLI